MDMTAADERRRCCSLELPLGESAETFDLEKAVCSHGFFMMSPNRWDPTSRSLSRPLRLSSPDGDGDVDVDGGGASSSSSVVVRISQHPESPCLRIQVFGVSSLSESQRRAILAQVARMLRLSPADEVNVREFLRIVEVNGAEKECLRSFCGRVFRSPTLFEDMVKCILLCNCQWPRTLTMARSLCELQLELQSETSGGCLGSAATKKDFKSISAISDAEGFTPKTPAPKEPKRKRQFKAKNVSPNLRKSESKAQVDRNGHVTENVVANSQQTNWPENLESCEGRWEVDNTDIGSNTEVCDNKEPEDGANIRVGNFPSPEELACLDERFLAKRCNLGYRASRILKLARGIVEGKIQLRQLGKACREPKLSTYDSLLEQLRVIDGFGPFTCANVLMCMGFYHTIPTDSETIRHLKQVHAKTSNIQTVQKVVETVYGKYSPFQFLAYWAEVWHFYGQRFGKLSKMPHTDYKLITSSNMRNKDSPKSKRTKSS